MSCNSCSNVTLPGVQGPAGANGAPGDNGDGFTGGSYDVLTGIVTFTSNDGLGFSTGDLRGADGANGTNGTTLLKSITSEQVVTASSYSSVFSQSVAANSLFSDEDTLRFEGLVLNTESDSSLVGVQVQFASTDLQIGFFSPVFDWPNIEVQGTAAYGIEIDIVRVSSSSVRIESKIKIFNSYGAGSSYANSTEFFGIGSQTGATGSEIYRSSQTITSLDLVGTAYTFQVNLQTDSVSRPTKLTRGKLYLIKK